MIAVVVVARFGPAADRRPAGGARPGVSTRALWLTPAMTEKLEITRDIAASPEAVYAALTDVTRMGEWSEECHACEWHDGVRPCRRRDLRRPQPPRRARVDQQGKMIEADPGARSSFECSMFDFHFSTWGYRIEPTDDGSRVTEWSEDLRPESAIEFSKEMSGVDDRRPATGRP